MLIYLDYCSKIVFFWLIILQAIFQQIGSSSEGDCHLLSMFVLSTQNKS